MTNTLAKVLFSTVLLAMTLINAAGALNKLGAMGESFSYEYWDFGVSTFASNWVSQLAVFRGIDLGRRLLSRHPTARLGNVTTSLTDTFFPFLFVEKRRGFPSSLGFTQYYQT
jgi:hypothetical protein